jgi:multiple sugar transport system substrate-binding protein
LNADPFDRLSADEDAMSKNKISNRNGVTRRTLLSGAASAGLGLAATGLLPRASFGDAKFAGKSLNLLIIQPHVIAGRKLAADFEAATGAKINVIAVPYDQLLAKATLDVQSGANQYDVIDYWFANVGAIGRDEITLDVTAWIERDKAEIQPEDYLGSLYDPYTLYDGKRWGLPYDGDSHVLFFNKEIFDRHGLKAPTTWAEYLGVAKTITEAESKNGIYGAAVLGGKAPIIIGSTYANRLAGFGGAFLTAEGRSALDSEAAVLAAKALKDIVPYALPTPLETRFEEGLPAFLSGKAAIIEFWSDLGVYANDPKSSKIVDKWEVVRNPVGGSNKTPRLALNAGYAFGIASGSKQPELAWEFVKFATGAKEQTDLLLTTASGIDPSRKSTLYSDAYKKFATKVQNVLAGALENGLAWPTGPDSPQLQQTLADNLALILSGDKSPEQAIADTHKSWIGIIGA